MLNWVWKVTTFPPQLRWYDHHTLLGSHGFCFLTSIDKHFFLGILLYFSCSKIFLHCIPSIFQFIIHINHLEFLSFWTHFSWGLINNELLLSSFLCIGFHINFIISWNTHFPLSCSLFSLWWQTPSRTGVKGNFSKLSSFREYLTKESQVQNNCPQNNEVFVSLSWKIKHLMLLLRVVLMSLKWPVFSLW